MEEDPLTICQFTTTFPWYKGDSRGRAQFILYVDSLQEPVSALKYSHHIPQYRSTMKGWKESKCIGLHIYLSRNFIYLIIHLQCI